MGKQADSTALLRIVGPPDSSIGHLLPRFTPGFSLFNTTTCTQTALAHLFANLFFSFTVASMNTSTNKLYFLRYLNSTQISHHATLQQVVSSKA